ncbi:MAG: hypothetical protein HY320_03245 [Armatimonadetes bacterium]|nr:hypothetical protein [Armatimonadota bacterium]
MNQVYAGRSFYLPDYKVDSHRLYVTVRCLLADLELPVQALLDTACHWCVLPAELAPEIGYDLPPGPGDAGFDPSDPHLEWLHTRFGRVCGRTERIPIRFPAEEGSSVDLEATWFLSRDWDGPVVLGWKGCLERVRFGLDPGDDSFYFGAP